MGALENSCRVDQDIGSPCPIVNTPVRHKTETVCPGWRIRVALPLAYGICLCTDSTKFYKLECLEEYSQYSTKPKHALPGYALNIVLKQCIETKTGCTVISMKSSPKCHFRFSGWGPMCSMSLAFDSLYEHSIIMCLVSRSGCFNLIEPFRKPLSRVLY